MTIFDHPVWKQIRPFARISPLRGNVDLLDLPDDLRTLALSVRVACCACGSEIAPFRARRKSHRARISGTAEERRLFYVATCLSAVNAGCARSRAAKEHKRLVRGIFNGTMGFMKDIDVNTMYSIPSVVVSVVRSEESVAARNRVVALIDASLKFAPHACREAMVAAREILAKENS